jgi:hypothetical protein
MQTNGEKIFRYGTLDNNDILVDPGCISGRPSDKVINEIENNSVAKCNILAHLHKLGWFTDLQEAMKETQRISGKCQKAKERLTIACQEFSCTALISSALMACVFPALIVGLLVEYSLTLSVLPAYLNVRPDTLLGYMLGAISLVITVALEQLIAAPLRFHEQCLRERKEHRWSSAAWWCAGVLIAAAVAVNGIVLIKLGHARETARQILWMLMHMVGSLHSPQLNPPASTDMVIWVGVVSVLDCAVLLRAAVFLFDNLVRRIQAARAIQKAELELDNLEKQLTAAQADEDRAMNIWENADSIAKDLIAAALSRDRMQICEIRSRTVAQEQHDLAAIVDRLLIPGGLKASANHGFPPATSCR